MKLYYFMIIAIGLMFTFNLAGIDTGSHKIFQLIGLQNNNVSNISDVDIVPDVNVSITKEDIVNPSGVASRIKSSMTIWLSVVIAIAIMFLSAVMGGVSIAGSGVNTSSIVYVITSGVATFILSMFAFDFFSIVRYMAEITGGTGWEYYLVWILIFPFLATFAFQLIKFIQGTD